MKRYVKFGSTLVVLLAVSFTLSADVLRLRDGSQLEGTFLGANTREIQFVPEGSAPVSIVISSVAGIEFETAPPPAPPSVTAAPVSTSGMIVPAGTQVTVRLIDGIDSKQTAASERFRASVDDPVVVGNSVVIPRGADCTVQVVAVEENQEIAIKLYDVTLNGRAYDVVAGYANVQGQGTSKGKKAARRGLLLGATGAAIGGIAGGGQGAAIGAVSGAGLGAISGAAAKGKTLNLPPETRLTFELRSPLPL